MLGVILYRAVVRRASARACAGRGLTGECYYAASIYQQYCALPAPMHAAAVPHKARFMHGERSQHCKPFHFFLARRPSLLARKRSCTTVNFLLPARSQSRRCRHRSAPRRPPWPSSRAACSRLNRQCRSINSSSRKQSRGSSVSQRPPSTRPTSTPICGRARQQAVQPAASF